MGAVGAFTGTARSARAERPGGRGRDQRPNGERCRPFGAPGRAAPGANRRLQTRRVKGAQRAALAANGVDIGVGSAAESLATTDIVGERDANTIRPTRCAPLGGLPHGG